MNTILLYLFMTPLFPRDSTQETYSLKDRYNDSLHIYRTYVKLHNSTETDTAILNEKKRRAHEITCAAQKKLSAFNHEPYQIDTISFTSPKPSVIKHEGVFIESEPTFRYIAYDYQTRFTEKPGGGTDTPYIRKITFDKGRIIEIEKLNPVTFEKLP